MKQVILLLAVLVFSTSFRQGEEGKDRGSFNASVDGEAFKLDTKLFRGILINKEASMDGRTPARTVISTNFKGATGDAVNGKAFTESVEFEINYKDPKTGPTLDYVVVLQYKNTSYYMIKDESKLNITQMNFEADKKHFWLAADFVCKMRSMGYPNDGKKDVMLKGNMADIRVTVPSWIAAKM